MAEETINMIKKLEANRSLSTSLVDNYFGVITNLIDRGLLREEEYTSHGNVRLYAMPLDVFLIF